MTNRERVTAGAVLGAEVDRLVIGVHREVGRRFGSELRERFSELQLDRPGVVIDLAEFLLADACTPEVVRLRFRYEPDDPMRLMEGLVVRGLLNADLGPASELAELADLSLGRRAEVAADLWPGDLAVELAGARAAATAAGGELAVAFRSLPVPTRSAAALHHELTTLRYERMDAHAAAWESAGLTAGMVVALTTAIDDPVTAPVPAELAERELVMSDGTATSVGRALRSTIEDDTNRRCEHLPAATDDPGSWLGALSELPSEPTT